MDYETMKWPEDIFLERVAKTETCWYWTGHLNSKGYGIFKKKLAHRASYKLFVGPIPPDMLVCHTCDTPDCVNPEHLFLGTFKDNTRDMINKGRAYWQES